MNKRLIGVFLILLLALASPGADKRKKAYELIYQDVQLLRQQFFQLKEKIEKNSEDVNFIKEQLEELLNLVKHFQTEQASMKEDQKKIPTQYQILLEKLETMTLQLIKFSEVLTEIRKASLPSFEQQVEDLESRQEQPPPAEKGIEEEKKEEKAEEEATSPSARLSPKEVYSMAYSDYRNGNFELAIDGFKMYREQFPESPLADNSLYWIGECYFSQKKYERAIEQFNELILNYPRGDKIPAAYLKKGFSFMELGKKEEALSVFKLLISKYPLEEETKIAQQKIKELLSENERYQQP